MARAKGPLEPIERVRWVLVDGLGRLLTYGHPDPKMIPFHVTPVLDYPHLVTATDRDTLLDAARRWNEYAKANLQGLGADALVHPAKVRLTIEQTEANSVKEGGNRWPR